MKHFVIYRKLDGIVCGYDYAESLPELSNPEEFGHLEVQGPVDTLRSRVVDGEVFAIPERPSPSHLWQGDGWTDAHSLPVRKSLLKAAVDKERARRTELPILYSGHLFDADSTAQRNLTAWMTALAAGLSLPVGFTWRDHSNVDHPAQEAFVVGLGGAITLRGTLLYQRAWHKKAEIDGLTLEQVAQYSVTDGWE